MHHGYFFWCILLRDISCFHLRPFSSINDHFETSKKQKNSQNTSIFWLKIPKIELIIVLEAFFCFLEVSKWSFISKNGLKWKHEMSFKSIYQKYYPIFIIKAEKYSFRSFQPNFSPFLTSYLPISRHRMTLRL